MLKKKKKVPFHFPKKRVALVSHSNGLWKGDGAGSRQQNRDSGKQAVGVSILDG